MNQEKALQWIAVAGISIGALFLRLLVITKIWFYLFVPMGASQITTLQAYGVTMLIQLICSKMEETREKQLDKVFLITAHNIGQSLVSWAIAYCIFG